MLIRNFKSLGTSVIRRSALRILDAGIAAVLPEKSVRVHIALNGSRLSIDRTRLDLDNFNDVWIVGAGKGSSGIAFELERILGSRITGGMVIDTAKKRLNRVRVLVGDHPIPSKRNVLATRAILDLVRRASPDDLLICVFTGGGSALFEDSELELSKQVDLTKKLLRSGASIHEINIVRKHVSRVKGGRLAELAWPMRVVTLLVSDVNDDDVSTIASGPTLRESSSVDDAKRILRKYGIVMRANYLSETPSDSRFFKRVTYHVLADRRAALRAMANKARSLGFIPRILNRDLSGEARVVGAHLGRMHVNRGTVLLAGGETTVTIQGKGKGGRNQELALGALGCLRKDRVLAAIDSDGVDFISDSAGAIVSAEDIDVAKNKKLDVASYLANNDSFGFFKKLGRNNIVTGKTGTNIADLVVVVQR